MTGVRIDALPPAQPPTLDHVLAAMKDDQAVRMTVAQLRDILGVVRQDGGTVTGDIEVNGDLTKGGQAVWHPGNFDPAVKADLAGAVFTAEVLARVLTGEGAAGLAPGDATRPGFLALRRPDQSLDGYVGYSDAAGDFIRLHSVAPKKGYRATGILAQDQVPAFYAYKTGGAQIGLGAAEFAGVLTNNGGHYDGSTHRFTAPVSGFYTFAAALFVEFTSSSSGYGTFGFRRNGASWGASAHTSIMTSTGAYQLLALPAAMYLDAGDYVDVLFNPILNTQLYPGAFSAFCGHFVG